MNFKRFEILNNRLNINSRTRLHFYVPDITKFFLVKDVYIVFHFRGSCPCINEEHNVFQYRKHKSITIVVCYNVYYTHQVSTLNAYDRDHDDDDEHSSLNFYFTIFILLRKNESWFDLYRI